MQLAKDEIAAAQSDKFRIVTLYHRGGALSHDLQARRAIEDEAEGSRG